MPDISMCPGTDCPLRDGCYRFTATPTPGNQTYFNTPPIKDGKCDYYWPIEAKYYKPMPSRGDDR